MAQAINELSADTIALEQVLMATSVGDVVTYAVLSERIGRNVQQAARGLLRSARHRVQAQHGALFEPVINVGLKRLDDVGKLASARATISTICRTAQRGLGRAATIEHPELLPAAIKPGYNVTVAQLGVLREVTTSRTAKRLEAHVGNAVAPTAKMLDAMKETL